MYLGASTVRQDIYKDSVLYLNFIIFSDGHRSNIVLLSQLFGERGRHNPSSNVRWGIEMPLSVLPSG